MIATICSARSFLVLSVVVVHLPGIIGEWYIQWFVSIWAFLIQSIDDFCTKSFLCCWALLLLLRLKWGANRQRVRESGIRGEREWNPFKCNEWIIQVCFVYSQNKSRKEELKRSRRKFIMRLTIVSTYYILRYKFSLQRNIMCVDSSYENRVVNILYEIPKCTRLWPHFNQRNWNEMKTISMKSITN